MLDTIIVRWGSLIITVGERTERLFLFYIPSKFFCSVYVLLCLHTYHEICWSSSMLRWRMSREWLSTAISFLWYTCLDIYSALLKVFSNCFFGVSSIIVFFRFIYYSEHRWLFFSSGSIFIGHLLIFKIIALCFKQIFWGCCFSDLHICRCLCF